MKFTELSERVRRHFSKYWNLIKQSAVHTHARVHMYICVAGRQGYEHVHPQTPVTIVVCTTFQLQDDGPAPGSGSGSARVVHAEVDVCLSKSTINWIDFILQIALNFVVQPPPPAAIDGEANGNNNEPWVVFSLYIRRNHQPPNHPNIQPSNHPSTHPHPSTHLWACRLGTTVLSEWFWWSIATRNCF